MIDGIKWSYFLPNPSIFNDDLRLWGAMEAAERTARQKEQAEKDKIERMNADLKEAMEWL